MFFDYIRILKEFQPKFFLAENISEMFANRHSIAVQNILELFDATSMMFLLRWLMLRIMALRKKEKEYFI